MLAVSVCFWYMQFCISNLVSSLTGHAEGSRAFNRYRDIDIDMKRDLVKIFFLGGGSSNCLVINSFVG